MPNYNAIRMDKRLHKSNWFVYQVEELSPTNDNLKIDGSCTATDTQVNVNHVT